KAVQLLNDMEKQLTASTALQAAGRVDRVMPSGKTELAMWQRLRFVRPENVLTLTDSERSLKADGKMGPPTHGAQSYDGSRELSMWSGMKIVRKWPQQLEPSFPFSVLQTAYHPGGKLFWPGQWRSARVNDLGLRSISYLGQQTWNG